MFLILKNRFSKINRELISLQMGWIKKIKPENRNFVQPAFGRLHN